jgi:hypothetical protein
MLLSNATPSSPLGAADACQHASAPAARKTRIGHGAHIAHVAVVAAHTLCCGAPVLMALAGAAAGMAGIAALASTVHTAIHDFEWQLVALSAVLVGVGGLLEWRRIHNRRPGSPARVSWLFAASCLAFVANTVIVVSHAGSSHAATVLTVASTAPQQTSAIAEAAAPQTGGAIEGHGHDHAH